MNETPGWSQRDAIRAAAGGMLRIPTAGADNNKMTRQQAQYQDTPNSIYSCATCALLERLKSCKVVEGEVSEEGWCKAFALVD